MLPGVFITQRMTDTARVIQQWAGDELRRSSSDLLRATRRADAAPGDAPRASTGQPDWSRSAGVMEQVSKAAAESGLVQAWSILPGPRFLSRGSALSRIPPPPHR
jgi:hypothetical protein